jgi:tight adherence protein C
VRRWTSREFLATKIVEGLLVGAAVFVLVSVTGVWQLAVLCGGGLALVYPYLCRQSLLRQSETRLQRQRVRLPFVIDQISLMMQAGAGFEESLRSIAAEDPDHPLTEELQIVLGDITAGRTRRDALSELKERIPDREFGELFFSIIKGEELGTPLSTILSEQADQMRIKRSQWGEKAAAEAEVQIVFPGMLVMIACLIVVLGPIMLPAVTNLFGTGN